MSEPEKQNYNAADPGHVKSRKQREERELLRVEDAQRFVMGDPRGRYYLWTLLESCGIFHTSFTGNSATFFNEGRRDVGLRLMAVLEEKTPKEFLAMWQEHLTDKAKPDSLPATANEQERNNG
jgi:hypothetical protein